MCQSDCDFERGISLTTFNASDGITAGSDSFCEIRLNEISFFPDIFKCVVNCHFITSFFIFSKSRLDVCC